MKKYLALFIAITSIFVANAKTTKILFVGNSYTYVNDLPKTIQDLAISKGDSISYTTQATGGATAQTLWNTPAVVSAISQGGWDFVVLQCQSQEPAFPPSQVATDTYPFMKKLDSLVQAKNSCAETLFFMTWGRKNGDAVNAAFYPIIGTYDGMQSRLRESYLMFAQDFTASVAPVGVAWKNVRAQYPTIELYNPDESHPSIYGTYLAACVFYSSIFHKVATGASFISTGISTTDATSLQTIASNTVLDSLDNWQQYGNLPFANYAKTSTDKTVVFNNLSKHFTSSFWDFGDGLTSNSMNPTHTYLSDGNYSVCLTVTNTCGKQEKFCNTVPVVSTPNALNEIKLESTYFIQNRNTIVFKNLNAATDFRVISMNGEVVKKGIAKNESSLSLDNLHGIYLIHLMYLSKPIKILLP
jgi:hypothetical protein